jgi:hypothetical protein
MVNKAISLSLGTIKKRMSMKSSSALTTIVIFLSVLYSSCTGIIGTNESACTCMYFDSGANRIISTCSAMEAGREQITKIVASTQTTGNFEFNTTLKDTSLATPSHTFNLQLGADAVSRIKNKGITVMAYTGNSSVWYKLSVGPANIGTTGKHYFTFYKRGL